MRLVGSTRPAPHSPPRDDRPPLHRRGSMFHQDYYNQIQLVGANRWEH